MLPPPPLPLSLVPPLPLLLVLPLLLLVEVVPPLLLEEPEEVLVPPPSSSVFAPLSGLEDELLKHPAAGAQQSASALNDNPTPILRFPTKHLRPK
jgi:hypothetical protein